MHTQSLALKLGHLRVNKDDINNNNNKPEKLTQEKEIKKFMELHNIFVEISDFTQIFALTGILMLTFVAIMYLLYVQMLLPEKQLKQFSINA